MHAILNGEKSRLYTLFDESLEQTDAHPFGLGEQTQNSRRQLFVIPDQN